MKIYTKGTALAAAAVFALATAAPAMADHDTTGVTLSADGHIMYMDCEQFGGFKSALDNYVKFASDGKGKYQNSDPVTGQDREGLNGKLSNAHDKLHEDPPKPCDAAQKLDDFNAKVKQLVDANTDDKMKIWETEDPDGTGAIRCLIDGSAFFAAKLRDGEDCSGGDGGGSDKPNPGKGPKK
jgi:hypothetical protein